MGSNRPWLDGNERPKLWARNIVGPDWPEENQYEFASREGGAVISTANLAPSASEEFRKDLWLSRAIIGLIFLAASLPWLGYAPDDLFIHLRFARNLAHLGEWSFNPGEPVAGATSPPWVLGLAAAELVGAKPLIAAEALGLLTALALLWAFFSLLRKLGVPPRFAAFFSAALGISHWLGLWSAAGMETALAPFLMVAGLGLFPRNRYSPILGGCFLGLATVARPDAFPASLVLLAGILVASGRGRRLKITGSYALVAVFWPLVSRVYLGTWLPLTVTSKGGGMVDASRLPKVVLRTGAVAASEMLPFLALLMIGIVLDSDVRKRWKIWLFPLLAGMTYPLGYLVSQMRGGVEASGRYLVPWYGLLVLAAALALFPWIGQPRRRTWLVLAASLSIIQSAGVAVTHFPAVRRYQAYHEGTLMKAALWLKENAPAGSTVVSGDIGAVGFVGDVRVLDVFGIINPDAPRWAAEGRTFEALKTQKPAYVLNPAWELPFDMRRLEPYTASIIFAREHLDYRWTLHPGKFTATFREMRWD